MKAETETDALGGLEDRIVKTVQLVHQLRDERDLLLVETDELKTRVTQLSGEIETMRDERTQVRSRIEKLLGQIDQLSL